jgi:UDP-N-acetylmuramoylalanine--D-glutamate ligase
MGIRESFDGKRILIWGYGREGKSTEKFLKSHCAPANIDIYEGSRDGINEDNYDLIIKSPGIVMPEDDPKYTSQTEIFLEEYRGRTVGITGTKGKSTTSAMLYSVLKGCGKDALLVGNIGQPCLDDWDDIRTDTVVVFEMSCHQLEHCHVSPHIAVFLNLYEEHLDHYGTLDKYFEAKSHIASFQESGDVFLSGWNVPDIKTEAKIVRIGKSPEHNWELAVNGVQNMYNAEVVRYIAVDLLHLGENEVKRELESFSGLPHRLQDIGTVGGLRYLDDSISTIPEATIAAVESISDAVTVLVGGMDRGINYDLLVDFIRKTADVNFVCSYASGLRIYNEVQSFPATAVYAAGRDVPYRNCYYVNDLEAQVKLAGEITPAGGAVILSPAAASYGYFKNFEERGDVFRELVYKR